MSRPANGRFELPQPYNEDFIPASPGPGPRNAMMATPPEVVSRSVAVTSRYDEESQEVIINLHYAEPEREKAAINEAVKFARRQGPLRRIVLIIASEVFAQPESFHFCKRNGFIRCEGREMGMSGGMIVLEKMAHGSK